MLRDPRYTIFRRLDICPRCLLTLTRGRGHSVKSIALRPRTIHTARSSSTSNNTRKAALTEYFVANGYLVKAPKSPSPALQLRRSGSAVINTSREHDVAVEPPHHKQDADQSSIAAVATRGRNEAAKGGSKSLSLAAKSSLYLALCKPRLATLVMLSSVCSYALFPLPDALSTLSPETSISASTLTLFYLSSGTFLSIACANTLNMYREPHLDAQMSRTRTRPLARGLLTSRQALAFASVTGASGLGLLWVGVNPTVAVLSGANILLYAWAYTSLKQKHIINTWVGAAVGAIPPLMGWAAAAGLYTASTVTPTLSTFGTSPLQFLNDFATEAASLLVDSHPGGWILAALLYAWQFPHFNGFSWSIRDEYSRAGYKMMASSHPALNARVALRYSIAMFPICWALSATGVTDWVFAIDSTIINAWMTLAAWRFWEAVKRENKSGGKGYGSGPGSSGATARKLFWVSVWQLPVVLVLAMAHKKGMWDGVSGKIKSFLGFVEEEDDNWEYEDAVEGSV